MQGLYIENVMRYMFSVHCMASFLIFVFWHNTLPAVWSFLVFKAVFFNQFVNICMYQIKTINLQYYNCIINNSLIDYTCDTSMKLRGVWFLVRSVLNKTLSFKYCMHDCPFVIMVMWNLDHTLIPRNWPHKNYFQTKMKFMYIASYQDPLWI